MLATVVPPLARAVIPGPGATRRPTLIDRWQGSDPGGKHSRGARREFARDLAKAPVEDGHHLVDLMTRSTIVAQVTPQSG